MRLLGCYLLAIKQDHSSLPSIGMDRSQRCSNCQFSISNANFTRSDRKYKADFKYSLQVMLFGSLLLLDASLGFLIRFPSATTQAETDPATTSFGLRQVRWTISGALTSVLVCMTGLALLNKSLDKPGTLLVDNRYLRMGMRAVVIMVVLCLPTQRVMGHGIYVGIIVTLLQVTTWWEYLAGLERGSKLMDRR
jgi:hypothetical protein